MKRRSLGQMIVLTIVTLGIYQIFWLYNTKQEMNSLGQKVPPLTLLLAPYFATLAVVAAQFFVHFVLNTVQGGSGGSAIVNLISVIIGVLVAIAIIPISIYWLVKYCQAVEVVTNRELNFGTSFILWFVLILFGFSYIWPFIVQNSFNKVAGGVPPESPVGSVPPTSPVPPAPLVQ